MAFVLRKKKNHADQTFYTATEIILSLLVSKLYWLVSCWKQLNLDQTVHRKRSLKFKTQVSKSSKIQYGLNSQLPEQVSLLLTKADEWTSARGTSRKAAVDCSVRDGTLPVNSLSSYRFGLEFLYLKDCLLYYCIWQSLSTCWQITLCTRSSSWEVDMWCEMSTTSKALSDCETHEASYNKADSRQKWNTGSKQFKMMI